MITISKNIDCNQLGDPIYLLGVRELTIKKPAIFL